MTVVKSDFNLKNGYVVHKIMRYAGKILTQKSRYH